MMESEPWKIKAGKRNRANAGPKRDEAKTLSLS